MDTAPTTELILLRHAPAETEGRLCGRGDPPLRPLDAAVIAPLRAALDGVARRVTSPALRCRQTAAALWPGTELPADARLWEQDLGRWERLPAAEMPDLGPLSPEALAAHSPPGGESFEEVCARVAPALRALAGDGPVAVIAHAGTVRAGLAMALGPGPALAMEVAPLSMTRLRLLAGGAVSVACVNCPA